MVEHEHMEAAVNVHFTSVFGTTAARGVTINFNSLGISPIDLSEMGAAIGADEVLAAIRAMPPDRAPGPDGFPGAFYKSAWHIISGEVMEAIEAFCARNTRHLRKLNNAIVVLLPKMIGANSPSDFWPINMIHSFSKLLSKILALRLAPRMKDLVDHNQNAFVRERSIHDNYNYVQRAAVLIRKKKRPMLLLKLDIS
jgi:hypothetical protein